jgi:SAM-dependent methyltransferase
VSATVREVFAAAAGRYAIGNPLLILEREETEGLIPPLSGKDVLDLGAGRGHYASLAQARGARRAVGLDFTPEMVLGMSATGVVGDAQRLPFRSGSLDVVVAALVMSYLPDRRRALAEVVRVLRPGGVLVLSDLHPIASERGWSRTFAGRFGERLVLAAKPASLSELCEAIDAAGLTMDAHAEPVIDERLRPEFRRAGRRDFEALAGTPLLLLLRARKRA